MSNAETLANLSLKNARHSMKRLEKLENLIPHILTAVNKAVNNLEANIKALDETQGAMVEMLGREDVERLVVETRRARALVRIANEKLQVQNDLASGAILPAEKVGQQSIVTIAESGVPEEINQQQFVFFQLIPALQALVLGKSKGDVVQLDPDSHSFTITGIHDPNPEYKPAVPPAAEEPTTAKSVTVPISDVPAEITDPTPTAEEAARAESTAPEAP